jgi:hypothetical protein
LVDRWWFVVGRDQVNMVLSSWSTSGCSISRVGRSHVFSSSRHGLVLYTEQGWEFGTPTKAYT